MPNISKLLPMAIIPLPVLTPTPTDITSVTTRPPESAPRRLIIDRDRVNIEIHQLIWLDANVKNDNDSAATMASVRKIIDYTKVFDNVEECKRYIEQTNNGSIFLISTGSLGERIVADIHEIQHIYKIYLTFTETEDKDWHKLWPKNYSVIL